MSNTPRQLKMITGPDGAAVLDAHTGQITTFNATGAYIWQALDRGEELSAISLNLAYETGEPHSIVEAAVREFSSQLRRRNLWPR